MFCSHDVFVAWAHLRLTSLELAVHVGIKYVVPSSQPDQNDLLWSVLFVEAVWLVKVWVLLLPFFFLGEGFDDGLFINVRGVYVLLVSLASFPSKPVYLFISLDPAACWNPLQDLVCLGCEVDQGSFHLVEILLAGILVFAKDRVSICEDDHIGLGSGWVVSDLSCGFFESFSFCFKIGKLLAT